MKIDQIYIGGWFQRTTLHFTEIFDFLNLGTSNLDLSKDKLHALKSHLNLKDVTRHNWLLEYLTATSNLGIALRVYEDGLVILNKEVGDNLKYDISQIEDYYDTVFSPAISYLFSKGAPVPKELAQIKTLLPFIFVTKKASNDEVKKFFEDFNLTPYSDLETPHVEVHKSSKIILIVTTLSEERVRQIVEEQVFFREFKAQLHRYLNIHRFVWEEIAKIKEMPEVPGNQIRVLRGKLEDYQKTIELIESRINQMKSYITTRAKISKEYGIDAFLDKMFYFKFETLEDTLAYVKELWKMTDDYLKSSIELLNTLQTESTKTSITSLQLVTTLGVVATIITYLGRDKLPTFTIEGGVFFVVLVALTGLMNALVTKYFSNKSYTIRKNKPTQVFNMKPAKEEI